MSRRPIIIAAALATGMAFIDSTALNVALPTIRTALDATPGQLLWIHNAYAVPLAALLLLGGSLGDIYGTRRTFAVGVILFAIASAACGFSPNAASLIAFRCLQGIGASLMIPGSLALIARAHPDQGLGRAIGLWSAFTVVASALGPVLGGILAQNQLWRGVFLINIPLAAICLLITITRVPTDPPRSSHLPPNIIGSLLLATALAALSATLISHNIWLTALAVLGLVLFVVWERRIRFPLLPAQMFSSRPLVTAALISLLLYTAWGGFTYLLPTHLINKLGTSSTHAGLLQLPAVILLAAISPLSGKLRDKYGPRLPLLTGTLLCSAGFALTHQANSVPLALVSLCLLGIGLGFCAAPISATILTSVSQNHQGLAAGINSTVARIAQTLGVAILGTIAFQSTNGFPNLCLTAAILTLTAACISITMTNKTLPLCL